MNYDRLCTLQTVFHDSYSQFSGQFYMETLRCRPIVKYLFSATLLQFIILRQNVEFTRFIKLIN